MGTSPTNSTQKSATIFKRVFRYLQYALDWVRLVLQILNDKKSPAVVLCFANPGSIGGTELQIQLIAEGLKLRFRTCLIILSGKLEEGQNNLFLKRLNELKIDTLILRSLGIIPYKQHLFLKKATTYLLKKVLRETKICHFFNPASTQLSAVMKSLKVRIYYMETGMPAANEGWEPLKSSIGEFGYVTSVSSAGLRSLERIYGYQGPSSIIPSMFPVPPARFVTRKPTADYFNIVYFGRMTLNKGVDLLIEAFAKLIQEVSSARLFLIGSGERAPLLQELVRNLNLCESVQFFGWLQNEALFSRLAECDLFCLPSFSEGLPTSILEAMSIGLPVLATRVGGIPEIVEHEVSGVLVPPRDLGNLTQALFELARNPLHRLRFREQAFERLQKMAKKEDVLNALIEAYEKDLHGKGVFDREKAPIADCREEKTPRALLE